MEAKFFRFLKIVGVGFKARTESEGRQLFLKLGYSHEVEFAVPPAVRVFCFKPNIICCTGIDKERVHQFAGAVRSCKPPEVYKGKGIMYIDEVVKKKQGGADSPTSETAERTRKTESIPKVAMIAAKMMIPTGWTRNFPIGCVNQRIPPAMRSNNESNVDAAIAID
ncbi:60S ribosomal protein L6, mitochondrial, partial [Ananas comosus]